MNIYISNLVSNFSNKDLEQLFSEYGEVSNAEIVTDGFTGVSRGFGYVEMNNEEEGLKAIENLNKKEVNSLVISVEASEPKRVQKGSYKIGNGPITTYKFRRN